MRGIEFLSDLRCNYLTVLYEGPENDFALRMLTENMAEGFLQMELRRLDGQVFLYYNISGMQSMENLYAEKTIDRKAFETLMWNLHDATEQSRELFLPADGICMEPSAVFWNLKKQKWEFVYIPQGDMAKDMRQEKEGFAEFLVMRIDYEDKKLTDTVYRFYEEICAGRPYPDLFSEREETESGEESKAEQSRETEVDIVEPEEDEWEDEGGEEDQKGRPGRETRKRGKGWSILLSILWCAVSAAVFLLGRSNREIVAPGGAVVALLTVLLAYNRVKSRQSRYEMPEEETTYAEAAEEILWNRESGEKTEETEEEQTVYMDIEQSQERKLYGIGKSRREKIFLDRLPCTVGKDKMMVNHIISDASVSRMHARFFVEEKNLWMQDLNSTNGTYHNGLRLRPNEKVMLEPEDEVGFGRVQFVFR